METLGLCFLSALICCYYFWIRNIYRKNSGDPGPPAAGGERPRPGAAALLVTAHPDDECMFFAPALLRLAGRGLSVHLLCLSTGNFYKQGDVRKKELLQSCAVLGIPSSRVTILDHSDLPDNPGIQWDPAFIAMLILRHVQIHHISLETSLREEIAQWMPSSSTPIHKCSPEIYLHPGPADQLAEAPLCDVYITQLGISTGKESHVLSPEPATMVPSPLPVHFPLHVYKHLPLNVTVNI
ncbi:N-acetylglucosaminyl-phosphatidylinositol de-N-acetylase isoform X2 [Carcharodon carcharias]|uniref:N-acetylglucosaminyl-phosphatidylinositol de-N-acetylase isoform X2 n=1 Tax=Carcharodon carcharias TaxID=13397 RepID=UPI001B7F037C|nr:N-acetylglucosaminyl-phosphatidylinositol de-N-acetylase isoform X2 [Carcharodon carcharias]